MKSIKEKLNKYICILKMVLSAYLLQDYGTPKAHSPHVFSGRVSLCWLNNLYFLTHNCISRNLLKEIMRCTCKYLWTRIPTLESFIITKSRKRKTKNKCSSVDEWIHERWNIYSMEHYSCFIQLLFEFMSYLTNVLINN